MSIFINPGSGAVDGATEENAVENIKHFIVDNAIDGVNWIRVPKIDYGDGRYAFLLWKDNNCYEIQMPGLPLERVRYMSSEQNIWNFPRLYVDGGSWVWSFALGLSFECDDN